MQWMLKWGMREGNALVQARHFPVCQLMYVNPKKQPEVLGGDCRSRWRINKSRVIPAAMTLSEVM